ncbi:galactose oxidase [Gigaspora margarita]|uniref:Galactose oxidase n=1 Tax=Gigaspora margarita TaxID=4874 RepID=A0A8H3X6T8_GIGMA|nr:galactose oxidase [Gigaspora margarita]
MNPLYIYILLLNFQLSYVLVKAYTPIPRNSHRATLIGNKLYILGGDIDNTNFVFIPTKDSFFYLDVSVAFNTTNIPWMDLSKIVGTPIQSGAAVSAGGPNKNIIFLVGGGFENSSYGIPLVYTFDTVKSVWNTPIIKGTQPTRRGYIYSIIDVTAPTPRDGYSATLLPNGIIAYIGGYGVNGPTNLKEIYLCDTKNNAWETMISVGTIPDARAHQSSVLGLNNDRIIIYGGYYSLASPALAHDLSVLDIRNKPYRWFTPNILVLFHLHLHIILLMWSEDI